MRFLAYWSLLSVSAFAVGSLKVSTPGYPADREADYTTSHVYVDEIVGTAVPITFRFEPGVGNVDQVQLWTNVNRRDLANIDKNGDGYPDGVVPPDGSTVTDSAADTDPETGHYFIPMNMNDTGGGVWELTVPMEKTGAYRVTARYSTSDQPGTWRWYGEGGNRDHAVVVAPRDAREIRLYEINVFTIEASGDRFEDRSTIEDLHNAPGAPHNGDNRWDLDYLENLGANWLWFQPIHPNGVDGREVDAATGNPYDPGSPYAVKNFFEVNPLMSANYDGGKSEEVNRAAAMLAWQNFVAEADEKRVGIMLDAPFNHTAFDVELAEIGVDLFQPDGANWSPSDEIRNRDARFFSQSGNYGTRAYDVGSIASAPDREDFGKWHDVKDVFFGRYDALVENGSEPERSSYKGEGDWFDYGQWEWNNADFVQNGQDRNVTRLVWQYFAEYAVHWLEKTRPAGANRNSTPADGDEATRRAWDERGIDGLRCDFGQGLPPQCWEYIINTVRSKKWNFVMMTESLDGGEVTYRSARHFELLNENIVFPLKSASTKNDFVNIYEGRRSAYGQALVLANTTSHDEEVMDDPWQSVVRYLATAGLDGAPMIFPGQELGIFRTFGYDHYELNFGKDIPHFKRWNSMMPAWNDTDYGNDQLYQVLAAANRARAANSALRSSNRWFLNGDGGNDKILAVAKYDEPGVGPVHGNVVLAFSNLDRDNVQGDHYKIPGTLLGILGLDEVRQYNVRNAAAYENAENSTLGRSEDWLWGSGYSGGYLRDTGMMVSLNKVPASSGAWVSEPFEAQYLRVYDVTPPPAPDKPVAEAPYVIGTSASFSWGTSAFGEDDVAESFLVNDSQSTSESTVTLTGNYGDSLTAYVAATTPAGITGAGSAISDPVLLLDPDGDQDGDGVSNADEVIAGTNPLSAASVFKITEFSRDENGTTSITTNSVVGKTYRLWTSTTLKSDDWTAVGEAQAGTGGALSFSDTADTNEPRRFYRVEVK